MRLFVVLLMYSSFAFSAPAISEKLPAESDGPKSHLIDEGRSPGEPGRF